MKGVDFNVEVVKKIDREFLLSGVIVQYITYAVITF